MPRLVVPGLLLVAAGLPAAEEAPVIRLSEIPIHFTAKDLSQVETASLWVTANGGASWQEVARQSVAADAQKGPTFTFRPPADGSYGFATRAELRDGSADPKPLAGQPPQPKYVVVVDRSAPLIEQFEVVTDAQDPLLLTLRWRVGDAHPGAKPVQFAMAPRDGGDWIPFGPKQAAAGSWTVAFPRSSHQLRLEAVDRAGNRSRSEPWQAELPPEPSAPVAAAEPAAEATTPTEPAPASLEATDPALSSAIAELPDPEALAAELPPEPRPTFVDSPPAAPPESKPAPAEAPAPAPSEPPMALEDLAPLPALPAPRRSVERPSAVLSQLGRSIPGDEAELALDAARSAAAARDNSTARALYRRLADSPLAAEALLEEVLLLARTARAEGAIALAAGAPAEARSDRLHALHARLLLQARRFDEALRVLPAISSKGPLAREALWLQCVALGLDGQIQAAAPVLRHLAVGDDDWARLAREWLRRG